MKLIVTAMKNEGAFILEWVAYHRMIGFSDFLIYTNDCDDGTVELLDRLTQMGIVRHERNEVLRRGPHKSALKYAFAHPMTHAAEWIMISDVDEFLNIRMGGGSVQELIAAQPENTDAIPVAWRLFSHDDKVAFVDEPVMSQFTDAERGLGTGGFPDRFVKTVFRGLERLERFGLHRPVVAAEHVDGYVSRAPDGELFEGTMRDAKARTHFAYEVAQVNHYAVRSIDSYLLKRDRGRANHVNQVLGADYWQKMCRGGEEDLSIQRHLKATQAEIAELRSDPEIDQLHRSAVSWHAAKIEQLRADPAFEALRDEVMALSAAADHKRARTDTPMALRIVADADATAVAAPVQQAAAVATGTPQARLADMCREMRSLIDQFEPIAAAEAAQARLDEIERGLLGQSR